MQFSALAAGGIYLLWPTTMDYPSVQGESLSSVLLAALMSVDSTQNCLPSLHVTLTFLAVWAAADSRKRLRSALLIAWGAVIALSILQLRRHLFVDLLCGVALALLAGYASQLMQRISRSLRNGERV
ncbi:PAP2 superfamily [Serratia rubidaea]|uniref:PAP2 superfamily n=1 Tax=Serratia rubidaea TaxID=61652 RepID=A0A3S4HVX0_SERRU|nr:PAP2 superfamily [Serratia rubidaea]